MNIYFYLIFTLLLIVNTVQTALAVPPPDFIFNVGAQIAQAFSMLVIFFSAILAGSWKFAKTFFESLRFKKTTWVGLAVLVIGISWGGAHLYGRYVQNQEYNNWIAESNIQNQGVSPIDYSLDQLKTDTQTAAAPAINPQPSAALIKPPSITPVADPKIEFIKKYYADIGTGKLSEAYEVSKKSVSLATFKTWYENTTAVSVDKIAKIDDDNYSLNLSLTEGDQVTSYGVLMTLTSDETGQLKVKDSVVRVLGTKFAGEVVTGEVSTPKPPPTLPESTQSQSPTQIAESSQEASTDFYEQNKSLALDVTNENFQKILDAEEDVYILDAREDEEFEIGRFPGSTHIRFADLLAGEWIKVPTDRVTYVFCWSGIRGEEVASFLREKQVVARYIKTGADGWVSFGGKWDGAIKFLSVYTDYRYQKLFDLQTLKEEMANGTVVVDSRPSNKYETWHIPESINIAVIYTPSSEMDTRLAQVPEGAKVITVCDDFVSCFDAKLTGVKLEKKGHEFLGRYNKPWEYKQNQ